MLIFGDHTCLIQKENMIVLNLSSFIEGFKRVDILPSFQVHKAGREFDIQYANWISNEDGRFVEFMKIIMTIYYGYDVYLLVRHDDELSELVTESIQKLIQQRYGLISNNINDLDDWNCVVDCNFNLNGLYNLDIDKERFNILTVDAKKLLKDVEEEG